jgi:glycosyltransferase involved in cell wall biosynthesis
MIDIKKVKLRSQQDIVATWKDKENIIVSVICATYNQEAFVEDAIIGILMQETDFAFEIIIHDDASTDKTADIIREYQSKYPYIIKPIFQQTNQFSLGNRPINFTLKNAVGNYVAMCEGDDYWIEPKKLSEQINFFKENPGYVLHVFDCYELREEAIDQGSSKLNRLGIRPGDHSSYDMKLKLCLLPLTSCFINDFDLPFPRYFNKSINGDTLLNIMLSNKGKAYVDNTKKVAVYRIHDGGIWSLASEDQRFYEHFHNKLVHARYFVDEKAINEIILMNFALRLVSKIGRFRFIVALIKNIFK